MEQYRETKATINLGAIRRNTGKIIADYPDYKYYMAVVKADCYGYRGERVIKTMLDGGVNCFAVGLLEEGLSLRRAFPDFPILLFTPVSAQYLPLCAENRLWVTVADLRQARCAASISGLEALIRANGGSDIFGGPVLREGFETIWDTLQNGECRLTGIYMHSYNAKNAADTLKEYEVFETLTAGIKLNMLEFVSLGSSLTLPRYAKKPYENGCRLGNILYRIENGDERLENTFRLSTHVLSVFSLPKGYSVAYCRAYTAQADGVMLAALPIGFGDGFSKTNIGRDVFVGEKRYPIVAVTMDITHILVDSSVKAGDEVQLIKDNVHLDEIAKHTHGAAEEAICVLNKRVYREYIDN